MSDLQKNRTKITKKFHAFNLQAYALFYIIRNIDGNKMRSGNVRIAIVDDEREEAEKLADYISENLDSNIKITFFSSGEEFLDRWKQNDFELIILDIYMEHLLGTEVARRIREKDSEVCLVFCTTSNEFASESYEVEARYYLLKPFTEERVKQMLNRLNLSSLRQSLSVVLPNGQRILLKNILYTECSGHNILIENKDGSSIQIRMTQKQLEDLLCVYPWFVSCSKGIIVNFHAVSRMDDREFYMSNGKLLPISRRKTKEIKSAYAEYCFRMMREGW